MYPGNHQRFIGFALLTPSYRIRLLAVVIRRPIGRAGVGGKCGLVGKGVIGLRIGLLEIVFVFLFVDLFDNVGTLVAVGTKARLFDTTTNQIPRMQRILLSDAAATITGSLAGTSTVVSYIESAAGVVAGGRSGVTSLTTGILFLAALFVAPLIGAIPAAATAPALVIVGSLMASHAAEIHWDDAAVGIPAFLTMLLIPLTFSIANGLAFGFTAFVLIRLIAGRARELSWMTYLLALLFLARFAYLGKG